MISLNWKYFVTIVVLLLASAILGVNSAQAQDGTPSAQLIAHWQFEEGNGTTVTDSVGGFDGTINGAAWSDDVAPQAEGDWSLDFDGMNDFIDTADFDISDDFTIMAWVNSDKLAKMTILSKHDLEGNNWFILGAYADGYHFNLRQDYYTHGTTETGWQHVVVVGEAVEGGTFVTGYVNGMKLFERQSPKNLGDMTGGQVWTIGQDWDGTERTDFFDGRIDDVRIYDGALSEGEIVAFSAETLTTCNVPTEYTSIDNALAANDCDIIELAAGTYTIGTAISQNTIIRGADRDTTILDAVGSDRRRAIINADRNSLTLENLTISNNSGFGSGIHNGSSSFLYVNNVTFTDNFSSSGGGAIFNAGGMVIDNAIFEANSSNTGGAIYNAPDGFTTITNSQFTSNVADIVVRSTENSSGGGAIYNEGKLTIRDTVFHDNLATATQAPGAPIGGAIFSNGQTSIHDSTFTGNRVHKTDHYAPPHPQRPTAGGCIFQSNGTLFVSNSVMHDNSVFESGIDAADRPFTSGSGGCIFTGLNGTTLISDSTLYDNQSEGVGGAIASGGITEDNAETTIQNSTLHANTARAGGAIISYDQLSIFHSTLYNNTATSSGGAVYVAYPFFQPDYQSSTLVSNSTISGNSAENGAAITVGPTTRLNIENSTIVDNVAANSADALALSRFRTSDDEPLVAVIKSIIGGGSAAADCSFSDAGLTLTSGGFNLSAETSCGLTGDGDLLADNLLLGPLADNGGPTLTHMILDGSPALDAYAASCTGTDQIGNRRGQAVNPFGPCDIGAVEVTEEQLLIGYFSPWLRYSNWIKSDIANGGGQLQIGQDFRHSELTRPEDGQITTLTEIEQNYRDNLSEGRLFWRYCADYSSFALKNNSFYTCDLWVEDASLGHGHAVGDLSLGESVPINIHQILWEAIVHGENILYQEPTVRGDIDGTPTTPQQLGIDVMLAALEEQASILLIYGNEFMVDATRHNVSDTVVDASTGFVNTGPVIIRDEIEQLKDALAMYELATSVLYHAMSHQLAGEDGHYLGSYFTPEMFALYSVASERQIDVLTEIAEREWHLSFTPGGRDAEAAQDVVAQLNDAYASQYLQVIAFAHLAKTVVNTTYVDAGGRQLNDNLDKLLNMAETIRTNGNPLGYDEAYVPTKSFVELYERFTNHIVEDALASELAAIGADRTFDQNASQLLAPNGELALLTREIRSELAALCGASNGPDYDTCSDDPNRGEGSDLELIAQDLRIAHDSAALAWQEAMNISQYIRIEQETAQALVTINLDSGEPLTMDAYELAVNKVNGYSNAGTTGQPAQDPYDPEGAAFWITLGDTFVSCAVAGASAGNALADRCADNFFDPLHDAFGTGHGRIDAANEEWSPANDLAIANMQNMREAERDADIVAAQSDQRIRELLIEQSDLLLAYEIEVEKMNRVILERNALMTRYQQLSNDLSRFENDVDYNPYNPAQRVIRDHSAETAHNDLNRAIHYAYMTAKALEYSLPNGAESFNTQIPYHELFQARRVEHVHDFVELLYDTYENIPEPTPYLVPISIARDIFGLDDVYLGGLLGDDGYTPNSASATWPSNISQCNETITELETLRYCLFQERLQRGITDNPQLTGTKGTALFLRFSTLLDVVDPFNLLWYQKIAPVGTAAPGCTVSSGNADGCQGVSVDILTNQTDFPSDTVITSLTHKGVNSYRRPSNGNTPPITYFSPGRSVNLNSFIPSVFNEADGTSVTMQANINGQGFNQEYGGFEGLSSAASDWRLVINLSTGSQSLLDVTQVTDIVLTMDTLAYSANRQTAADAQAVSDYRSAVISGEEISAETQAEVEALAEKYEDSADTQATAPQNNQIRSSAPLGGSYIGSFAVSDPAPIGIIDFGLTMTTTENTISGHLCADCSPHVTQPVTVTGVFTEGDSADTFHITSATIEQTIDGQPISRVVEVFGTTARNGDLIEGLYRETILGVGSEEIIVEGNLIGTRPSQNDILTSVGNQTQDDASPMSNRTVIGTAAVVGGLVLGGFVALPLLRRRGEKSG